MDFTFSRRTTADQTAAKDYAERELIKDVLERDARAEIPWQHIKTWLTWAFSDHGRSEIWRGGMDTLSYVMAIEEISKIDASMGVILSVHNSLPCYASKSMARKSRRRIPA